MKEIVRVEAEDLLQDCKREDFPVVNLRGGARSHHEPAVYTTYARVTKSVVNRTVNGRNNVFES